MPESTRTRRSEAQERARGVVTQSTKVELDELHSKRRGPRSSGLQGCNRRLQVYDRINVLAKLERTSKRKTSKSNARTGVYRETLDKVLAELDWVWVPTMKVGQGCTVHLRSDELPPGRIIVRLSRHFCAVIDGVPHDTHDCSRKGTRCVYGYWRPADV